MFSCAKFDSHRVIDSSPLVQYFIIEWLYLLVITRYHDDFSDFSDSHLMGLATQAIGFSKLG